MENSFKIKIVNLFTFFVVSLFLNYIFGKFFDLQVIVKVLGVLPDFIGNDITLKKLIVLLFYGVYVFIYIFFITYLLRRIFGIHKTYIYTHLNAVIIGLFIVGFMWIKFVDVTYTPSWYIIALPLISVITLFLHGLLVGKLELFDNSDVQNGGGLLSSIKSDMNTANAGIGSFFTRLKDDLNKETEDTRYSDNLDVDNRYPVNDMEQENPFGNIDFDENNNLPFHRRGDDLQDDFIDIGMAKDPIPDIPEKISTKDIKSILKGNRENIQRQDIEPMIGLGDDLSGGSGINNDGTIDLDGGFNGQQNNLTDGGEDGYIDVGQFDDEDRLNRDNFDNGITVIPTNIPNNNSQDEQGDKDYSKYFIVGYNLDTDEAAVNELLKIL